MHHVVDVGVACALQAGSLQRGGSLLQPVHAERAGLALQVMGRAHRGVGVAGGAGGAETLREVGLAVAEQAQHAAVQHLVATGIDQSSMLVDAVRRRKVSVRTVVAGRGPWAGFTHFARVANISSTTIGLAMWSFMPAASTASRSPTIALAVIAITGSVRSAAAGARPGRGVAVHDGHLAVHQHRIEALAGQHVQRLLPVAGDADDDTGAAQQVDRELLVDRVVLDQQDARSGQRRPMVEQGLLAPRARVGVEGARPSAVAQASSRVDGVTGLVSSAPTLNCRSARRCRTSSRPKAVAIITTGAG